MSIPDGAVWLDARGSQSRDSAGRGIGRFVSEHIEALLKVAPEAIGSIRFDPEEPLPAFLEPLRGTDLLDPLDSGLPEGKERPAIYHVMSPFELLPDLDDIWPPSLREGGCRLVVTLHDLIPLVLREHYLDDPKGRYAAALWTTRLGLVRAADLVVTNSRHTAEDAMEHLRIPAERVKVIDSGVSDKFSSLVGPGEGARSALKGFRRLRQGFLLYVGGNDPRKNLEGTIRAYALLPEELRRAHQLLIVCNMPWLARRRLHRYGRSLGIRREDLLLVGFVSDRALAALYRSCHLLIFPSLYEGAGLPVLEAMSCGAPVAASNTTSIPELLGDPEGTFDPADPADIARSVTEVLETPGALARLRERSARRVALYTWDRVARETITGY